MRPIKNHILIRADRYQKQKVGEFFIVPNRHTYEQNGIDTNPCIAEVICADEGIPLVSGECILLHHNIITDKVWEISAESGQFSVSSIPFDRWVLAKIDHCDGGLMAMKGNLICERIRMPQTAGAGRYELPDTAIKYWSDKVKVIHSGVECVSPGDVIGILKYADYPVSYIWKGELKRRCVVWENDVVCKLTSNAC